MSRYMYTVSPFMYTADSTSMSRYMYTVSPFMYTVDSISVSRYMYTVSPFMYTADSTSMSRYMYTVSVENIRFQMLEDGNFVFFAMFQKCFGPQRSEHQPETEWSRRSDS